MHFLAGVVRRHFLCGVIATAGRRRDALSSRPERRDYAPADVMILRFELLAAGSSTFSFVSGQGGEKQSIDVVSLTTPYWNFLRVRLN